jgi:hypothetical protein
MDPPELERLRRFCLAIALVLVTYVFAGMRVDASKAISILGLPLTMSHPELIPVGLMIASGYSALRFWYYGFTLRRSPRRKRSQILRRFKYIKAGKYSALSLMSFSDKDHLEELVNAAFPQFPRKAAILSIIKEGSTPRIILTIPRRIIVAGWFEDIDYSAPIWLNLIALILAVFSLMMHFGGGS